jgi:SAM-dependent methyltransferase
MNKVKTTKKKVNVTKGKPLKESKTITKAVPETKIALDLGCGQNKVTVESLSTQCNINVTKVLGVDFVKGEGIDVVHDLTKFPYPFEDNSIDAIYSSHFVEHLEGHERAKFMDECWRILKPGGKMRLIHPHGNSCRAVQDFTHKWPPIVQESYLYWNKEWREANKLTHGYYDLKCDFPFPNIFYTWQINGGKAPEWPNKNDEIRNHAITHYINVIADMVVDLTKK